MARQNACALPSHWCSCWQRIVPFGRDPALHQRKGPPREGRGRAFLETGRTSELVGHVRDGFEEIGDKAVTGDPESRRLFDLVYSQDHIAVFHAEGTDERRPSQIWDSEKCAGKAQVFLSSRHCAP